jgi:hypothetical protein
MTDASELVYQRIRQLGDWRAETLAEMRRIILAADPEIVEEWKWVKPTSPGVPVWSHHGGICTGETYKNNRQAHLLQRRLPRRPGWAVQLQPRRQRPARHRHQTGRRDRQRSPHAPWRGRREDV